MNILWVGGLDRSAARFAETASAAGHTVELHRGDVRGHGGRALDELVERSDVVVINTEINSHGGMHRAKRLARRLGRPAVIVRSASVSALRRVIAELGAGGLRDAAAAP